MCPHIGRITAAVAVLATAMVLTETAVAADNAAADTPLTAAHHREGGSDNGWGDDERDKGKERDDDRGRWGRNRGRWSEIVAFAANNGGRGFWVLTRSGEVHALNGAPDLGGPRAGAGRYVAMAGHPKRAGFWVLGARGKVHAFGAARAYGWRKGVAVGIAPHRSGRGYWVAMRTGRVRAFGAARHHGDARRARVTVDGIVAREDADGYLLRTTRDRWLQYPKARRQPRDDRSSRDRTTPRPPPTTTNPPTTGGLRLSTVYGITVARSIAENVRRLMVASQRAGVRLGGWGYRSTARQIELRRAHCGRTRYAIYEMPSSRCNPPTARPGTSMHEKGLAIDFYKKGANGRAISIGGTREFRWLKRNAHRYGLYNLPSEPWHWSTNGR